MSGPVWIVAAILLTGCATAPEIPKVVQIPVPVPCIAEIPPAPVYAREGALFALDDYSRTIAVWLERRTAIDDAEKVRAILQGCVQ